jgi:acyl dehydratase
LKAHPITYESRFMLYAEDLAEGQQFQLGTYTISEDEIIRFARDYDPIPIHIDPVAAKSGPFGGVIASGLNTMAIYQRLIVDAVWSRVAGLVGRSFEIRLRHPVRPGDAITGQSTIRSVTLRPERRDAIVIIGTELLVGDRPVLSLVLDVLVHMRPTD